MKTTKVFDPGGHQDHGVSLMPNGIRPETFSGPSPHKVSKNNSDHEQNWPNQVPTQLRAEGVRKSAGPNGQRNQDSQPRLVEVSHKPPDGILPTSKISKEKSIPATFRRAKRASLLHGHLKANRNVQMPDGMFKALQHALVDLPSCESGPCWDCWITDAVLKALWPLTWPGRNSPLAQCGREDRSTASRHIDLGYC